MNRVRLLVLLMVVLLPIVTAQAQNPRVFPQEPGPDGGLVHVVRFGDTLQSIMAAYASYGITLERLQELNGWRFPPQFIYVDEQIIILPPGSVEPGSGLPVPASAAPAAPAATAPAESVASDGGSVTVGGGPAPAAADGPAPEESQLLRLTAEQIAGIQPVEVVAPFLP